MPNQRVKISKIQELNLDEEADLVCVTETRLCLRIHSAFPITPLLIQKQLRFSRWVGVLEDDEPAPFLELCLATYWFKGSKFQFVPVNF